MNRIEDEIYNIIYEEMNDLLNKMLADYQEKIKRKQYNWTVSRFDDTILSHMVFARSFESKQGNAFENIIRRICELNFGKENVPNIIRSEDVTNEEYDIYCKEKYSKKKNKSHQYIISKFSKKNDGKLSSFRAEHAGNGKGEDRTPSTLTQEELPKLLSGKIIPSDNVIEQPVDLLYYDKFEEKYQLFEIKAGGDLDSSNAPKNVEKLLKIYSSLGEENANIYFATIYHKDGEGNTWTGNVKTHLAEDCILIGEAFWEFILPDEISFDEFKEIYFEVFDDLEFEEKLSNLINDNA